MSRLLPHPAIAILLGQFALFFLFPCNRPLADDTLVDAMVLAYQNNPALQAGRAQLRSTDEQLPEAMAGMRPVVHLRAGVTREWTTLHTTRQATLPLNGRSMEVNASQPLYQGGQVESKIRGAENRIMAERARLLAAEQTVLLAATTAFMSIVRDRTILELNTNYQKVLQDRFEIEKRRLRVGENTKTDVSQAESRLAQAIAARVQSESTLHSSIAEYIRVVGSEPGTLKAPRLTVELPATRDEVIEAARAANPAVVAARYAESAARDDVDVVDGQLLPTVNAIGSFVRTLNPVAGEKREDVATVGIALTLPLDNGAVAARARGARQVVGQRMFQIDEEQKRAVNQAMRDWNNLTAARAIIRAREIGVRSANVVLSSLRNEVDIGARTVTDLLNAEQDALSARTSLTQARYDEVIASLSLLADVGRLTAQAIKLPVDFYDYEAHYLRVRDKVWGVSLAGDPK